MKKWLVGLLAAGLCVASAWAADDVLTRETTGVTGNSYTEWTATGASGAEYAGQSAGGSESIQLRATSPAGIVMTKSSGSDVASVTVEWNDASADGRTIQIYGSTVAYTAPADLYGDDKGTLLGEIVKGTTSLEVPAGYPFIGIRSKEKALYLTSVTIGFAGASGPSVLLSASATEVEVGEALTITATATGFSGDVAWAWEGNDGGSFEGAVYTVNTAVAGEFTIAATATAGEETASKDITVTVAKAKIPHAVTVTVEGNGTAEADVAEAKAGEPVTLTVVPGEGYKVGSITVNGVVLTGTTFDMIDEDVAVVVTFVEKPAVSGDELTRETTGVEGTQYKDWTATGDSGAEYAGNSAGSNESIQLRAQSPAGIVMTKSSGSDVASVTVEWNDATADKRSIEIYGSTDAYAGPADLYGDSKGTLLGTIARSETSLEVSAGYPYIGILPKGGALYLSSVTIGFGGATSPSVSLSASATEVEVGAELTITATANNFSSEVEWSWAGNGTADGSTFAVDTSAEGEFTITATATAGEETASKDITVTVKPVAVPHAVNIATGIQHGVVTADPESAVAETAITLTATAEEGYKLESMTVTYGETTLSFTSPTATFAMPDEDVDVGATFVEFTAPAVYITFEEGTYPTSYAATEAEVENHGTLETLPTVKFAVEQTYQGKDDNDKKVGNVSLRMRAATSGDVATNGVFGNAEAFEEAISSLSFQYARYGSDAAPTALKVLVSADGETWDELADLASTATAELQTYSCDEIPAGSVFFKIELSNSTKSFKRVNIDEIALEFGAPKPTISYEGETSVEIPGSFSIQFTLKNYDGGYAWAVESGEGGTIDESGLYTWTPSAGGEFTIKVKAVDGDTEIASKEVVLTVTAPEPPASYISCNLGTAVEATVGVPVAFEFTANGVESVDDWYAEWKDGDEIALAYSGDNMSASFDWTPSEAGSFTVAVSALVQPDSQLLDLSVIVTVSEAGPGGDLAITGFSSSKAGLSFDAPADGVAVEEATSLTDQDWTPINIAPVDGKIVIPLNGEGKFYRFAK